MSIFTVDTSSLRQTGSLILVFHYRAQRSTEFVRDVLRGEGLPDRALEQYHSHTLWMCVATLAHQDKEVAAIAALAMNHSDVMAKSYQRGAGSGVLKIQRYMGRKLAESGKIT